MERLFVSSCERKPGINTNGLPMLKPMLQTTTAAENNCRKKRCCRLLAVAGEAMQTPGDRQKSALHLDTEAGRVRVECYAG